MRILLALALLGCAAGDGEDLSIPRSDAATDSRSVDAAIDSYTLTDAPADAIFPVEDTAPAKTCVTPSGTTVTASGSYGSTPEMALDQNIGTLWNSGGYTGWLKLKFPAPVSFDRVRLAANALPACNEPYVLKSGTSGAKIGDGSRFVPSDRVAWLDPFEVSPGTHDELLIEIGPADSWITLAEVQVFDSTGGCPAP